MTEDTSTGAGVVGLDSLGSLRLDCYIRSNISRVSERQVEALLERIRALQDAGFITDYRTVRWPPKRHTAVESQASETTRGELLAKFESWADQRGYSLEPAFERRTIHSSLVGTEDSHEEVRVPIVTLALYSDGSESAPLTGVVPYTESPSSDNSQTYTIAEWLSAVESHTDGRFFDTTQRSTPADGED